MTKQSRARRGRPVGHRGEFARVIVEALCQAPGTAADVAASRCIALSVVQYTCTRLIAAGLIRVVDKRRSAGASRAAAIYSATVSSAAPSARINSIFAAAGAA